MAGGKEDEADPPPAPPPSLDQKQPMEDAAGGKLGRSEHHHGVADAPSFRMEDLPAEIRPLIISLLPLKEAVRTSIVSTSWRMLWTFHCNLCFDGPDVPESDTDDDTDDEFAYLYYDTDDELAHQDSTKMTRAKFIEIVNWVIQRHSGIGINKFSIKCGLLMEYSDHLNRWIGFAASSKAKIINLDLTYKDYIFQEVYHFPLETLDAEGSSFVQSLFLAGVSIKPHSGICGFTILRRLVLECVQIFGDFPGLLAKCSALEDLEIIGCYGVTNLSIPHKLDKLQHLVIDNDSTMGIEIVEFHAADLAHFEYIGRVIPIVLHGCSKLEKAKIMFKGTKALARAFTAVPSILSVKTLNVQAFITEYGQLQKLPTRPQRMFMHLRHMTCQLTVCSSDPNADNEVLQLAHCLDAAPGLETLHLHMCYDNLNGFCSSEVVSMRPHGNLKTVFMSGFYCYKTQIELACCILGNACVLEQLTIEPRVILGNACVLEQLTIEPRVTHSVCPIDCPDWNTDLKRILLRVCEWAQVTSERFGKVITVLGAPLHKMEASLARQEAGSLQRHH